MLIISDVWRRRNLKAVLVWTLVSVGTMQGVLGISQVFRGSDFGLRFLGEQPLSLHVPGVAKVDVPAGTYIDSNLETISVPVGTVTKTLRAYGTLQHPNIVGGVLLASLAASTAIILSNNSSIKLFIAHAALGTTITGLIGTFSRSAWISMSLIIPGIIICSYRNISSKRLKQLTVLIVLFIVLLIVSSKHIRYALIARIVPAGTDQFIDTRLDSLRDFNRVIRGRILIGAGTGIGFIEIYRNIGNIDKSESSNYKKVKREYWQYQYPHNVPFVIVLEIGVVGLGLVIGLVLRIVRLTHLRFKSVLVPARRLGGAVLTLGVSVPLLTDHYLWTSQQGRVLFWGILGILLGLATSTSSEDPLP